MTSKELVMASQEVQKLRDRNLLADVLLDMYAEKDLDSSLKIVVAEWFHKLNDKIATQNHA